MNHLRARNLMRGLKLCYLHMAMAYGFDLRSAFKFERDDRCITQLKATALLNALTNKFGPMNDFNTHQPQQQLN